MDNYNQRPYNGNSNGRYNNGGNKPSFNQSNKEKADNKIKELIFNSSWISNEADASLVEYAEKAGKFMANNGLTNSKIRSIYGEIKRIQMGEFEKEKSSFYLLKPKVAYALGRDEHNEGLRLFKLVFDGAYPYVSNQKTYLNFCNFIEAILAYHKANGGRE